MLIDAPDGRSLLAISLYQIKTIFNSCLTDGAILPILDVTSENTAGEHSQR
jgi:hypothetical protein